MYGHDDLKSKLDDLTNDDKKKILRGYLWGLSD